MSLPVPSPSDEWDARTPDVWAKARRARLASAPAPMAVDNVEPSLSSEPDGLVFSDILKQALAERTYSPLVLSAWLDRCLSRICAGDLSSHCANAQFAARADSHR